MPTPAWTTQEATLFWNCYTEASPEYQEDFPSDSIIEALVEITRLTGSQIDRSESGFIIFTSLTGGNANDRMDALAKHIIAGTPWGRQHPNALAEQYLRAEDILTRCIGAYIENRPDAPCHD